MASYIRLKAQLVVWGDNSALQITEAPADTDFWTVVPGGADQTLAIRANGSLVMWGESKRPRPVKPLSSSVLCTKACISLNYLAAIRPDGTIFTWGEFLSKNPMAPPNELAPFVDISAGADHTIAIDSGGRLRVWGSGAGAKRVPRLGKFTKVRARGNYNIALRKDGRIYGWGGSLFESAPAGWQTENAAFGHYYVEGPFKDIAAGTVQKDPLPNIPHILALRDNGSVAGWGGNTFGEATGAPAGVVFTAVAAGDCFSIGLDDKGNIHHWGFPSKDAVPGKKPPKGSTSLAYPPKGFFLSIGAGSGHATAIRLTIAAGPDALERTVKQARRTTQIVGQLGKKTTKIGAANRG